MLSQRSCGNWPDFSQQQPGRFRPVADFEDAAAAVRVQADDLAARRGGESRHFAEVIERNAELGVLAGGLDVLVMSAPGAGVDAHQHRATREGLRPVLQHIEIVDRHRHALFEGPGVFFARREIRRVQHTLVRQAGERAQHAFDLTARYAFEIEPFGSDDAQDPRIWIGLDCVEDAAH